MVSFESEIDGKHFIFLLKLSLNILSINLLLQRNFNTSIVLGCKSDNPGTNLKIQLLYAIGLGEEELDGVACLGLFLLEGDWGGGGGLALLEDLD